MATHTSIRRAGEPAMRASQATGNGRRERAIFRRWQRYRLNLPIRLIVTRDDKTQIMHGRANDMSEGGMLVFAGLELKSEEKVFVEFTPPYSSDPVRTGGIVRHRRGYNYGLEFLSDTPADQQQTDRFRNMLRLAAGKTIE